MPAEKSSGTSASLTVGAAVTTIVSSAGLSTGENLLVRVDTTALGLDQALIVDIQCAVSVASSTVRPVFGSPYTVAAKVVADLPVLVVPAGVNYSIAFGLRGGSTARTIPWSLIQIERT